MKPKLLGKALVCSFLLCNLIATGNSPLTSSRFAQAAPQSPVTNNSVSSSSDAPQMSATHDLPYPMPVSPQEVKGGFWRSDHTFEPTLIITNMLEKISLPVTPSIYANDGTELELPSITLAPAGVATVDVRTALAAAPPTIRHHFTEYGSVGVRYRWNWAGAITTLVQNRDAKRSLNFNFDLRTPMVMKHDSDKTINEGLWWKEDRGVKGFLALANIASHTVDVNVELISDRGELEESKRVLLAPNETKLIDDLMRKSSGSSGGLRVSYQGSESNVVLGGGLENIAEGYSARIPLSVVQGIGKPNEIRISSVGLMYGKQDPALKFPADTDFGIYLDLRNTTDEPIAVTPKLYYMENGVARVEPLRELMVAPRQSRHWSPSDFASELTVHGDPGVINLVFSYEGLPADLIIANGALDKSMTFVSESHTRAVASSQAKILNDWDVFDGNDTMISVLNVGALAQGLTVILFFDGGQYKVPLDLPVGGSTMLSVHKIIQDQMPDADGNRIPLNAVRGSAIVSGSQGYAEMINIAVSSGVLNVETATCGNRCPTCLGYNGFQVGIGNPFCSDGFTDGFCPFGLVSKFGALALAQNGVWQDVSSQTSVTSWSSSSTSTATSQGGGKFLGNTVGTFTGNATANLIEINGDCAGTGSPCPWDPWSGGGSGTVSPKIMMGSTDITDKTQSVVVGQQVALTYTVVLPSGVTVLSQSWSVPGTTVGGFNHTTANGSSFPAAFNQASTTYYWTVPASSQTVTLTLNLSNQNHASAKTIFNISGVTAPTMTVTNYGKFTVDNLTGCDASGGGPSLVYGNVAGPTGGCPGKTTGTAGITFKAVGTPPASGGTFSFVQLVTTDTRSYTSNVGTINCGHIPGLDLTYPYSGVDPTTGLATDAPESPLPSIYIKSTRNFGATMYLMWTSSTANSIAVPLGYQQWQASATVTGSAGVWATPTGSGGPVGGFVPANGVYPMWTGIATETPCQ
jgi:hypothetical protein